MTYKPWLERLAVACWVGAVVLGGLVQLGWHAHLDWLLQVQPAYAPMKYNVALCFLLYGIGQLLQAAGYLRLARAAGAVIVMIAGLTLVEYILNADLGIDELFADAYLTVQTFHPGRMSTVTAVAFLLGGGALLVQTWRTVSFRIPVVVLLNALVVAIGASIVLAYSSDAMWRDPLGAFGRMAPNTAAALILISLATLVWLWAEESVSKLSRVRWSAVLAGFTIAVAALLLWQALVARNANEIRAETRYAAESLGALLASDLEGRVEALSRMARRWAVRNGVPRDEWEADAAVHIEDFVGFQAIEWVDPALQARWIVPREADTALLDADIALHSPSRKALQAAGDSRRVTVSPVIDLEPAVKGFRVHVPIFQGNRFDGFMVGVLRVPDILQAMRSRSGTSRYSLAISDAGGEIYRSSDGNRVSSGGYAQEVRLAAAGVSWRLLVEPEPSLVAQATSALPEVVLAAGLILSLLLTITLHTISLASLRADALARSNRDLQAEVQARAKADTALRETTTFLDSALDNMPVIF